MTTATQKANHLTIRDASTGEKLGEVNVGSRAVMTRDQRGTINSLLDLTGMSIWVHTQTRDMSDEQRREFVLREVTLTDEYSY